MLRSAVVLVRRGVFRRRVDGVWSVVDTTTGYLQRPGETQEISHPAGGDLCTTIGVTDEVADRLAHAGPVTVTPAADLAHRRLLAGRAEAAEVLGVLLPAPRVDHRVVAEVRALIHREPALGLGALASRVGWSPWHLSRMFHRTTGLTLTGYRSRLRVRAALDDLAEGASPAAAAARAGFADQAHLTRTLRGAVGLTPAMVLRFVRATGAAPAPLGPAPAGRPPTPGCPGAAGQGPTIQW